MTSSLLYVPALRLKQGEYRGLQRLLPDIADKICPRLVVPPPKERDPEKGRALTKDEVLYDTGSRIAEYWLMRPAFLDTQFLFKDLGETESLDWLPRIFKVARSKGAKPIPTMALSDAFGPRVDSFRQCLASDSNVKIALRLGYGEFNSELAARVSYFMSILGLTPQDCVAIADFSGADFSNPDIVAIIAQSALEDLQGIGRWSQIVFQGTNYPDVNPAGPDSLEVIPRNEWLAWKKATKLDGKSPDHLVFGDYGADCAKFNFKKSSGGIPIRHYRYATPESWIVVRGASTGTAEATMKDVCIRLLASGQFAGREFSSADNYIYRTAQGWDGPGNGSTWREINTAHHITRVVRDIGTIRGMSFSDVRVSDPRHQPSFFDDETA